MDYVNARSSQVRQDTVDVPDYDAPVASPKRLTVGPVTSVGSSASILEVPDKPNLHTFKRIHCAGTVFQIRPNDLWFWRFSGYWTIWTLLPGKYKIY